MSATDIYEHYLRGFINGTAKTTDLRLGPDAPALAAGALGWRTAARGEEPMSRSELERLVAALMK